MIDITTALHELVSIGGREPVNEPLRVALFTVLGHVDELVDALPAVDGLPPRAPRPLELRDVAVPSACSIPVQLEHAQAEKLCAIVLTLSARVNDTILWVREECDDAEFIAYRRRAGSVMGYLYLELERPLWRQYPDLEPAEMREPG